MNPFINPLHPYTPQPVGPNHHANLERFLRSQVQWIYVPAGHQHPTTETIAAAWLRQPAFRDIAPGLHDFLQTPHGRLALYLAIGQVVPTVPYAFGQLLAGAVTKAAADYAEPRLTPVLGPVLTRVAVLAGSVALAGWITKKVATAAA